MKPLPRNITIGEKYEPAMKVKTQREADEYLERCVEHSMTFGKLTEEEAEKMELENIGYFAGYYDPETKERVYELFNTQHPIFGKRTPGTDEALLVGMRAGIRGGFKTTL